MISIPTTRTLSVDEFAQPAKALRVKKIHPDAVLPSHAKANDAGYDVVALDDGTWDPSRTFIEYQTGLTIEPPVGYHTELFPRSSVSKYDLILANSVGLVDNGYRGELRFRFKYVPRLAESLHRPEQGKATYTTTSLRLLPPLLYRKGDKIGQIVIRKTVDLPVLEVQELSSSERGEGGFGSTGV